MKRPLRVETGAAKEVLLVEVEAALTSILTPVNILLRKETAPMMIGRIGWQTTARHPAIFVMEVLVSWDGHIQAFCIISPSLLL